MHATCLVLCFLVLLSTCGFSRALDVSFIPNDENAPLPLSQKYRESLRKLCKLLNGNPCSLPPEIEEKRNVLSKICVKLAKDDTMVESQGMDAISKKIQPKVLFFAVFGIGATVLLWKYRAWLKDRFMGIYGKFKNNRIFQQMNELKDALDDVGQEKVSETKTDFTKNKLEAREARLRRFQSETTNL